MRKANGNENVDQMDRHYGIGNDDSDIELGVFFFFSIISFRDDNVMNIDDNEDGDDDNDDGEGIYDKTVMIMMMMEMIMMVMMLLKVVKKGTSIFRFIFLVSLCK